MKLPNGFGTVYKMQGNRRRPYVAKKTIQGKQKAIGYFETFEEAMACLVAYNRDPALLSPSKTTFSEVYALWKAQHFPRLRSEAARISYRNSYKHSSRLHSMIFVDIRLGHLDQVIDDVRHAGCGYPTQKKVRSLLEQLYKLTPMEDSFGINAVALVDGQPRTLGLKELLRTYVDFRIGVVRRRTEFRLAKRKDRLALESIAKEARQLTGGAGPEWLRIAALGQELDPANAFYFLSVLRLTHEGHRSILTWRKQLFLWLSANAASRTQVFHLPPERTVVMGGHAGI